MAKTQQKTAAKIQGTQKSGMHWTPEYTEEVRASLVTSMLMPDGPSALALSKVTGISQPTLSRWLRETKESLGLIPKSAPKAKAAPKAKVAKVAPAPVAPKAKTVQRNEDNIIVLVIPRKGANLDNIVESVRAAAKQK